MGFFADVGPMQIFVSIHLIPPDLKFLPDANPPNFSNEEQIIEKGAMVRIKIMGLRMDVKDIVPSPIHTHLLTISLRSVRSKKIILVFSDLVVFCQVFSASLRILPYVLHCERFVFFYLVSFVCVFACTVFK